ncbi:MAG: 4'-phosphopantetheinyl transferase family protein [Dissulfuribacterales bacterium]
MDEKNFNTIFPVILSVPLEKQNLSGREQFYFLKQHARQAVRRSAEKKGIELFAFEKDEDGVPVPEKGWYWSLSHKPAYVAGVTANQPVGIDLEHIRPVKPALFKKVADDREWQLADTMSDIFFYRYWTAKEAVLKANGTGLVDLSKCKIDRVVDGTRIAVAFRGKTWTVEHVFFDTHVASVTIEDYTVQWDLPPELKI